MKTMLVLGLLLFAVGRTGVNESAQIGDFFNASYVVSRSDFEVMLYCGIALLTLFGLFFSPRRVRINVHVIK